eukprot:CAMPEP_0176420546 /NCGR_PEP_ID=MMETSP0127-20121128/8664_1 /TAXON_ID=938130 /ORGANISM="Platyophrya macrostoma, Strain WH" /LENGTH=297 /DNA_ID=CAMNT_0017801149 /DNA_START=153 /DNA_END=1046 /DNA_ORIENTATION=+
MWKAQYNKTYGGPEEQARFNVFKYNHQIVHLHNAQRKSYTLALNQFADLTNNEFAAIYTGASLDLRNASNDCPEPDMMSRLSIEDTIDWRTQGRVGPVKNQGQCGSCWAFSTVGALEGLSAKDGSLGDFSEQELVDCTTDYGNNGCGGGWVQNAFHYVLEKGIANEADYPYSATDETCKDNQVKSVFKPNGCANVAVNSTDALKQALQFGPVSVYVEADTSSFQFYSSGVVDDTFCFTNKEIDHAVLAVGYDSNSWIVKNSWGEAWGNKGYIQIATETSKDARGVCGILSAPNTYPL